MASLVSDMTLAELTATLEILSSKGVTTEDVRFIRKYSGTYAWQVASALIKGRALYEQAVTTEPDAWALAVDAVEKIVDVRILTHIYEVSQIPEVWSAVMRKITNENEVYHLVRIYGGQERATARMIGIQKLGWLSRHMLTNEEWCNSNELSARRQLVDKVEQDEKARGIKPPAPPFR